jgi:hypothetical protein
MSEEDRVRDVWLVDIDGTVALRGDGSHVRGPYDWHRVHEDVPNPPVVHLLRVMLAYGDHLLFLSGRNEVCRPATFTWLRDYVFRGALGPSDRLAWDTQVVGLLMRPDTDEWRYAPDDELKRWLYETAIAPTHRVVGVLDDRDRVVKMWRDLGLTCLQVAPGDF